MVEFSKSFEALTDHPPFPWQERLYQRFMDDDFPETCLIPTGLGKTSIIAIWLIALANKPTLPRRLVYVVNRRTVVDQTSFEVEKIRDNLSRCPQLEAIFREMCALDLEKEDGNSIPLAISTLRGQYADNQQWSQDPARPAVICGTVDMIGSRLLFSGYRCGFKSKPMQAGFLGQNALLVHDEAHLEPAFQQLIEEICKEQKRCNEARPLQVMALSATVRKNDEKVFKLTNADRKNAIVKQRITATKTLHLHPEDNEKKKLVDTMTALALNYQETGKSILIFARSVETVEKISQNIEKELRKRKIKDSQNFVATLTGTMRGLERNRLIETGIFKRFRPDMKNENLIDGTVYLICTSAGEVGVNISADHMICDLTSYDSMAQRLGRVNRFGQCEETHVNVVHPTEFPSQDEVESKPELKYDLSRHLTLLLLQNLKGSASPHALDSLDNEAKQAAFSPTPEILHTSDILFDAWANTTIQELPGRPPVEEYLHGKAEWEPSRTEVAWRDDVEIITKELLKQNQLTEDELLADYPLKPHELLSDRSDRIFDGLKKLYDRIKKEFFGNYPDEELPTIPVWITNGDDKTEITNLSTIIESDKKKFTPRTIFLPPKIETNGLLIKVGGLNGGRFDPASDTADDVADYWENENIYLKEAIEDKEFYRSRGFGKSKPAGMRLIRSIQTKPDWADLESFEPTENPSEKDRHIWHWYVRPSVGDDDGSKAAVTEPIPWPQHSDQVTDYVTRIADSLLSDTPDIRQALIQTARFHDLGKRRILWQRSIGNPNPSDWHEKSGKTESNDPDKQWGQLIESTRYRHEFGSLLNLIHRSEADLAEFNIVFSEFDRMTEEQRDIVLHLIAVHHGRGRPHFPIEETFDPNYLQEFSDEIAKEVPRRFARLQRRFGRWGLAWLESLFRAADYAASAHPYTVKTDQREVTL